MKTQSQPTLETPETDALLPVSTRDFSNGLKCLPGQQQLTCQDLKTALHKEIEAEDYHRKHSAIHELRAGVLFHVLRREGGLGYAQFWSECETEFKVNRATISKKMRLAVIWAKEQGASPDQVLQLAQAADLTDTTNPAVQLAFSFIGDQTTTDLYRKYKLVSTGPRGGDNTPRDNSGNLQRAPRRTKSEIDRENFKAEAASWGVVATDFLDHAVNKDVEGAHLWDTCTDDQLTTILVLCEDLHQAIVATQTRRKMPHATASRKTKA